MNFYFFTFLIFIINLHLSSFSIIFNSITPNEITQGENESFTISITTDSESINKSEFYIGDEYNRPIHLNCEDYINEDETITCNNFINFKYSFYLYNFNKKLFYNGTDTNLSISIKLPDRLKLLDISEDVYYDKIYKIVLFVNLNTLFSKNDVFRIGNNKLYNCNISTKNINYINCFYNISNPSNNIVYLNDTDTDFTCNIKNPNQKVLNIYNYINDYNYYINSNIINLSFELDYSYDINNLIIKLRPEKNDLFETDSCFFTDVNNLNCKFELDKSDVSGVYDIYSNNDYYYNKKIAIFPELKSTNKIYDINPKESLISFYDIVFTIKLDYFNENHLMSITLVNINSKNKIYLSKCGIENEKENYFNITCAAAILETGKYELFLNGISQKLFIKIFSSSLFNAYYIQPNLIKLNSKFNPIEIFFDSIINLSSNNISLRPSKNENSNANLNYYFNGSNYVYFEAKFPAADTYYLYINDKKQKANITIFDKNYTSKIINIIPKNVTINKNITFFLDVDTNFGINFINLQFFNNNNNDNKVKLECEPNSTNVSKAICVGTFYNVGEYYLNYENIKENDIQILVNNYPKLISFVPVYFLPYQQQSIFFYFEDNIHSYKTKISLRDSNNNHINPFSCQFLNSNFSLNCTFTANFEGKFYIYINNFNYGEFININENDNKNLDDFDDEEKIFYLKFSFVLLFLFIIF